MSDAAAEASGTAQKQPPQVHFEGIEESAFAERLGSTSTEVSSVALGGRILDCSDEWFAPASDLLKVGPAASLKGQFGPKGALFDGWETRRHNPTFDWVIVRLGPQGGAHITGFDVDTANFNGNEAPEVEVYGMHLSPEEERAQVTIRENDERWTPLLHRVPCKPSSRHLYAVKAESVEIEKAGEMSRQDVITHVKLHMIPDGGIARFRVYGTIPPPPVGLGVSEQIAEESKLNVLDLAHVMNGGRVVFTSDQHFGIGPNVLLPGRGKDMGDGWETKRSRSPDHKDWLIIKLGEPGFLNYAEIDTAHFLGNFPESVELHATFFDGLHPPEDEESWMMILPRQKTGPGRQHFYALDGLDGKPFSHIRVTMHPDGGIKRVRIMGRRVAPLAGYMEPLPPVALPANSDKDLPDQPRTLSGIAGAASAAFTNFIRMPSNADASAVTPLLPSRKTVPLQHGFLGVRHLSAPRAPRAELLTVHAPRLTPAAFAPYGDVITSPYASGLPEQEHKIANQGTAQKYEEVSDVFSAYPASSRARARIHIYRCQGFDTSVPFEIKVLERHQFTKQAFIPMSKQAGANDQAGYLVIVAKNGDDDLPDMTSLAAFRASGEQGISYGAGVWHHPMVALGKGVTDFACVVHDSTVQPELNCDEVFWDDGPAAIVNM